MKVEIFFTDGQQKEILDIPNVSTSIKAIGQMILIVVQNGDEHIYNISVIRKIVKYKGINGTIIKNP